MRRIGLFLLLAAAAALGTGCIIEPPSDIVLEYEITDVRYDGSTYMEVDYTVWNTGEYDLDDIQLYFEINANVGAGSIDYETQGWSSKFDLNSDSSTSRTFYRIPASVPSGSYTVDDAKVTRIGMDNPPDE